MFRGRFFSLSLSIESSGKTVLLPKWATEAQKVTIPSIVRIVILTDLQSNQPWTILEEYVDRIVSVVEENCTNVELQVNVGLTRNLPEGSETVRNTISETFKQNQCDALLRMLNFTSPTFDLNQDTITFPNLWGIFGIP